MIVDIPNENDFFEGGLSMLNLAWTAVASFYIDLEYSEIDEMDEEENAEQAYWKAAQQPISVALALAQQGIELLLKGKIAKVSPFLLLAGGSRDWPARCNEKNIPFADFRTVEAHELIKIHDTISSNRVSESFKVQFENLRRLRNIIFHGVDKRLKLTGEDVFRTVLEAINCLYEPRSWIRLRRSYLENSPKSVVYSYPSVELILISEALHLIKILKPSETKKYLGFDKKRRRYICYNCALECSDAGIEPKTAILDPNTSDSERIYCFICEKHYPVLRERCHQPGCRGNVLEAADRVCLTCYCYK